MNTQKVASLAVALILAGSISARAQLSIRNWEDVGHIYYTSAAMQGSKVVLATAHGYLYSTTDMGTSWARYKLDDTLSLSGVAFADSMHGLVVDNSNIEFQTTDGGATWIRSNVPATFLKLAYPQKDTAFAIAADSALWRTTDGGTAWTLLVKVPKPLQALCFLNARYGFIAGDSTTLFRTSDAGNTWTYQNGGLTAVPGVHGYRDVKAISFENPSTGIIGTDSSFWTTTDSGSSWHMHVIPNSPSYTYLVQPTIPLVMAVSSNKLLVVEESGGDFFYSGDGGNSLENVTPSDFDPVLPNCWVHAPQGFLLAGSAQLVEVSSDGRAWQTASEAPPETDALEAMTDTSFGAVADASNYFSSNDSGIFWKTNDLWLRNGGYYNIGYDRMHFFSPDTGIIFNSLDYNESYVTTDGGDSWNQIDLVAGFWHSPGKWLPWQVIFSHDGFGMVSDNFNHSLLYLTTDNSRTWETDTINDSTPAPFPGFKVKFSMLESIAPLPQGNGYVSLEVLDTGGQNFEFHSILLATTDAGKSWNRVLNAPDTPYIQSIVFRSFDTGILFCAADNYLTHAADYYLTTDAGQSWARHTLPGKAVGGVFQNDSTIFVSGRGNTIYFSTNMGSSWNASTIPMPSAWRGNLRVNNILFPDPNTIYLVTGSGYFRGKLVYGSSGVTQLGDYLSQFLYVQTYPDPASISVHARLSGMYSNRGATLSAEVYDCLGRKVMDLTQLANSGNNGNTSEFEFSTTSLADGAYMLRYSLGHESFGKPFVIIH